MLEFLTWLSIGLLAYVAVCWIAGIICEALEDDDDV